MYQPGSEHSVATQQQVIDSPKSRHLWSIPGAIMEVATVAVITHVRLDIIQIVFCRAVIVLTTTVRFNVATVKAKLQLFTLQLPLAF